MAHPAHGSVRIAYLFALQHWSDRIWRKIKQFLIVIGCNSPHLTSTGKHEPSLQRPRYLGQVKDLDIPGPDLTIKPRLQHKYRETSVRQFSSSLFAAESSRNSFFESPIMSTIRRPRSLRDLVISSIATKRYMHYYCSIAPKILTFDDMRKYHLVVSRL